VFPAQPVARRRSPLIKIAAAFEVMFISSLSIYVNGNLNIWYPSRSLSLAERLIR
jgi:hypothetical protein